MKNESGLANEMSGLATFCFQLTKSGKFKAKKTLAGVPGRNTN